MRPMDSDNAIFKKLQQMMNEIPPPTEAEQAAIDALESSQQAEPLTDTTDDRSLSDFEGDVTPGFKIRLSGLSERSDGTGMNRSSVYHAIAIKPIKKGRLSRSPGEFLCSRAGAKFGHRAVPGGKIDCDDCHQKIIRYSLSLCRDEAIGRFVDRY